MERSTDRYLHKKFKKQLSIEPNSQNVDRAERTPVPSLRISEPLQNNQNSEVIADVTVIPGQFCKISDDIPVKDSNDSVPKLSTNNENNLNATVLECSNAAKSSISHINVANVVEKGESNADAVSERSKQTGELVDLQQSSNSCISYVISKSSRVENQSQPESHFRAANFDTRFNVSEPIAIPTADTSSILDNAYSKQYVASKLVNVDKVGDISSNISIGNNDHTSSQEDSCNLFDNRNTESKHENHSQELGTSEKSSGGKYICSYCNLACSKPSVLQKHIRAHTNERPYPCVSCGFSFKTRSNLYKHCRSRTHANRVMGNKAQEIHNEADTDSQNKMEYMEQGNSVESGGEDVVSRIKDCSSEEKSQNIERLGQEIKTKPYKPRFHTAKAFFENIPKDNQKDVEDQKVPETVQNRPSNSDLLSLHINEVINKNNAIVNSNESYLLRKRSVDNTHIDNVNNNESLHRHSEVIYSQSSNVISEDKQNDEPLNLTNKTRKRCLSEVAEPAMHTSLIKELLLKNLYADSMQCPHCKMIFQTVTELELHKMRNCKGFTKSGARYSRSSSVNVASILTKNKNAFDNIPHLQNTTFPLKSPGPFLGKTRLVESDKCKSFSFDDGLPTFQSSLQNPSDILRTTLRYSLSPLTIQHDKVKKTPVKMFGGEVKITHTSGETKSFKIDNKDGDKYSGDHFTDYGGRLSENRVVKSSLQSGGTVLQNKPNYNAKQDCLRSSPDVIRVYESTTLSPSIDIVSLEKTKFNFERQQNHDLESEYKSNSELLVRPPADAIGSSNFNNTATASYKYTNIMDFSQKAVKLLAPNLKQPNLTIPGVPIPTMPTKIALPRSPMLTAMDVKQDPPKIFEPLPISRIQAECERVNVINLPTTSKSQETEMRHIENIQFAQKQILLHQKMSAGSEPLSPRVQSPNVCNPVNLLVNGKVVRYVPGIPGPVAADVPLNVAYANRPVSSNFRPQKPARISFSETTKPSVVMETSTFAQSPVDRTSDGRISSHSSQLHLERKYSEHERISKSPKFGTLEIKTSESLSPRITTEMKSPSIKTIDIKSSSTKGDIKSLYSIAPSCSGSEMKSLNYSIAPSCSGSETPKKFARPNTLALKPSIAAQKQHHGLTPTMFNQILISPDTPRVAKKYIQHFLHGNYFSYLGLKSSTKSVYCTLNKTQPFYVPHFKKLSMYSEWRQQDTKTDKLYVSAYDSRQRQQKYSTAGKATVDLVVHSSYKFVVTETSGCRGEDHKSNSILGGYESNEDYTYVRGRGRGRYVCDQCGIRCKKPSMLKKHIRTHTNDRPFTCNHCNFSFKTKGNLTKHMKSKAHTKNYAASSSSSSSAQQSGTQSSDSDTDDSGMDSSDESTRQQEHEAAYGLLSLSQKTTQNVTSNSQTEHFSTSPNSVCSLGINPGENSVSFMNTEQVTQVNNSNFAKNKILDQQITINFNASKIINEIPPTTDSNPSTKEMQNLIQFLGKTNTSRPLTYPYTSDIIEDQEKSTNNDVVMISPVNISSHEDESQSSENKPEQRNVTFNIVQKHSLHHSPSETFSSKIAENRRITIPITISYDASYLEHCKVQEESSSTSKQQVASPLQPVTPVVKINDRVVLNNVPYNSIAGDVRKRKIQEAEGVSNPKLHRMNSEPEAMDLSMPSLAEKSVSPEINPSRYNGASPTKENELKLGNMHLGEVRTMPHPDTVVRNLHRNVEYKSVDKSNFGDSSNVLVTDRLKLSYKISTDENYKQNGATYEANEVAFNRENESVVINLKTQNQTENDQINVNYVMQENHPSIITTFTEVPNSFSPMDYDNSAMETLADVATKQVKLEKNTLAKSVASEYLKLATKHEFQTNDGIREGNNFVSSTKEVNELIGKPEENKSCTICSKNFSKPSQLRLHMNIHYLERPFRCDPCSVSFRTKGHLQKHERSASHHNKLSSSPLLSSSEPRPFKCSDCNIAFRIHGHLAKHLRSKMHIMKLECLAKIPFGLYAELERANSLLTEINTTDGDQCLESLKALSRKVFMNDPSKLNQLEVTLNSTEASDS